MIISGIFISGNRLKWDQISYHIAIKIDTNYWFRENEAITISIFYDAHLVWQANIKLLGRCDWSWMFVNIIISMENNLGSKNSQNSLDIR